MKKMKKSSFLRLCLCFAVILFELPLIAQGVVVHKKDGTHVKFAYEEIDSIVVCSVGEDVEDNPIDTRAVDLGLSVKWASCNVGATSPEEYGGHYAWGETEEKYSYLWYYYKWCNGSYDTLTKYGTSYDYGRVDNKSTLDPEDDVAHVQWGGNWRMPTKDELDELRNKCSWSWTSVNGVNGYQVTGPNGNSIFLPGTGFIPEDVVNNRGIGYYWSASLNSNYSYYAYCLYFYDGSYGWYDYGRRHGCAVRPVKE